MTASTKKSKARKPAAKKTKKANKKGEATKKTIAKAAKKAKEAAAKKVPTSLTLTEEEMAPMAALDTELVTIRLELARVVEAFEKEKSSWLVKIANKREEFKKVSDEIVRVHLGNALDEYQWRLDFKTRTLTRAS